jgi:hypothetical protein
VDQSSEPQQTSVPGAVAGFAGTFAAAGLAEAAAIAELAGAAAASAPLALECSRCVLGFE